MRDLTAARSESTSKSNDFERLEGKVDDGLTDLPSAFFFEDDSFSPPALSFGIPPPALSSALGLSTGASFGSSPFDAVSG